MLDRRLTTRLLLPALLLPACRGVDGSSTSPAPAPAPAVSRVAEGCRQLAAVATRHVKAARTKDATALWETSGASLRAGQHRAAFTRAVQDRAAATWRREMSVQVVRTRASSATFTITLDGAPHRVTVLLVKDASNDWLVEALVPEPRSAPSSNTPTAECTA